MAALPVLAGWLLSLLFALAAYAMFSLGGRIQALLLLVVCLLFLPPLWAWSQRLGWAVPWWSRGLAVLALLAAVVGVTVATPPSSIYRSAESHLAFQHLYDAKLAEWPVPYEELFVDTRYGRIHAIASGPKDAPPVILINASALAGWSWAANVAALSADHRTYAIDNIGEVGKNVQPDATDIPRDGPAIAAYYTELTDKLGAPEADVVGSSIGGYIATIYALYAPGRVKRLVLLGPMGYGDTTRTILIMTLAQAFPLAPVQDRALHWALGDSERVEQNFGEWFRLVLNGSIPNPIPPRSLSAEDLRAVKVPTLAFFGTGDSVVGDADAAAALAGNIPEARVEIVESGHLIGAELPEVVNPMIAEFLRAPVPSANR